MFIETGSYIPCHIRLFVVVVVFVYYEDQGVLFRMFELQSKWVALVFSGKISLPSEDDMLADVHKQYREMEENGIPKRHTHSLDFKFEYVDWLAAQVGWGIEDRLKEISRNILDTFILCPNNFREAFRL